MPEMTQQDVAFTLAAELMAAIELEEWALGEAHYLHSLLDMGLTVSEARAFMAMEAN